MNTRERSLMVPYLRTCLLTLAAFATAGAQEQALELRDGDRVIFLGNSFFERALDYGLIETSWCIRWPERKISFRNLGWDGDTVYGHSRAGGRRRAVFGDTEEGFQRMLTHVRSLKPTVLVVAYGFNEASDGAAGKSKFRSGLRRLVKELSGDGVRFALFSAVPIQGDARYRNSKIKAAIEKRRNERNEQLASYNAVIRDIANELQHPFVNLFDPLLNSDKVLTDNGIHLNLLGYEQVAALTAQLLKLPPSKIEDPSAIEAIRQAVTKKNRLYFHRWRPRNDAFVYGERKDEQKIAQTEPDKFEPFVAEQEKAIRELLSKHGEAR